MTGEAPVTWFPVVCEVLGGHLDAILGSGVRVPEGESRGFNGSHLEGERASGQCKAEVGRTAVHRGAERAVSSNSQPASKVWGGVTQLSVSHTRPAPPPSRPRPSRAPHLAEVRGSPAPVAESVLEREEFREGPGGRGMPEHLQTPSLCAQAHAFRRVGLDWWKQDRVRVGSSGSFLHL